MSVARPESSMTAMLRRSGAGVSVSSHRTDSSSSAAGQCLAPTGPTATEGTPRAASTRATLTPLPPSTSAAGAARCVRPRSSRGTVSVQSSAGLSVSTATAGAAPSGNELSAVMRALG